VGTPAASSIMKLKAAIRQVASPLPGITSGILP
jgi:hypothetical protein